MKCMHKHERRHTFTAGLVFVGKRNVPNRIGEFYEKVKFNIIDISDGN